MNLKSINKLTRCMPKQISDAISKYYRPTFIWKRVSKSIHQGREYQYKFRHAQNVHLLLAFQLSLSSSIRSTPPNFRVCA